MDNVFDQFDAADEVSNIFDQFDAPRPQLAEAPTGPGFMDVARGELRGFETPDIPKPSFSDLIKGIPQGVAGVGTGIGSFVASLPMTLPKVIEGTMTGDPIEGIREARKEGHKIREAWTYQPTTRAGKIIAYDVAYPFMKAYEGLGAGVRALGGGDRAVEVAEYVADWALVVGPKAVGALKKGKRGKKPPPVPPDMLKGKIAEVAPDLPMEMVDLVGEAVAKFEKEAPPIPMGLKFEGNRAVVVGLRDLAAEREGFSQRAYEKAANLVGEMEGDVSIVDLKGVKGIGPKTQAAIEKILVEKRPEMGVDVPIEVPKAPETPIFKGPKELDPAQRTPVSPFDVDLLEKAGEAKMLAEGPKPITHVPRIGEEVAPKVSSIAPLIKSTKQMAPKVPEFKTLEEAGKEFEVGSEIGEVQALKEFAAREEGFSTARVGDKYFRTTEKYEALKEAKVETLEGWEESEGGVRGYRGQREGRGTGAGTEGMGQYLAKDREIAQDFGEVQEVVFERPKKPLIVDEEPLYMLSEMVEPWEPNKKGDSLWLRLNKEAVQRSKEPEDYPNIKNVERELTLGLLEEGYDAVHVKSGGDQWVVLLDKGVREVIIEPTVRELREAELANFGMEPTPAPSSPGQVRMDGKNVPVVEAAQAFKVWRESLVEKINQANPKAKETSPLVADEFKTFATREEGLVYLESRGQTGELIQDSMSKEWYVEPDFKVLDDYAWDRHRDPLEVVEKEGLWTEEVSLGEPGEGMVQDLVSLFNNERGGVDLTPLRVFADKLIDIIESAKKSGVGLEEYLTKLKIAPEVQVEFMKAARNLPKLQEELRVIDPLVEGILRPNPDLVVRHRVKKNSRGKVVGKYVPLTTEQTKAVLGARKDPWRPTKPGQFMKAVETRPYAFERFGPKVKAMFWDKWTKKATEAERERKYLVKESKAMKKTLNRKEIEAVSIHAYLDQHGGAEALLNSGVTKIPPLSSKAASVIEYYKGQYDSFIDRANYVRTRTGQEPIPRRDNYFPFIRAQNVLRERGILDSIVASPLAKIQGNLTQFKGTLFPFEKPRHKSDIPLELDIFSAYEKYISHFMKEVHVAPIAALAKELATGSLKTEVGQKKGRKLPDQNPGLSQLLIEWSDEILGVDPIQSALSKKHPFISSSFSGAHRNLVASMIFGNVGTVLKQPTALLGTYVGTSFPDLMYGISRLMVEKPFKWGESVASRKSSVLDIRRAELILSEFAEAVQMIKGKKKLAQQVTAAPMNIVDALAAEAGWYSGYRHAKKTLKYGEEKAIQFADDLVVKTHGMGIKGAVSPIQASGTYKWLTMLQTFAIADFNYLARDVLGIKNPDLGKVDHVKRVVRYVVGAALINEAFNAIGMDSPKPSPIRAFSESMEEDEDVKVATAKAFLELVEMVPLVGGSAKFGSSLFGPVGELAADIPEGVTKAIMAMDWEHMTKGQRLHTGLFLGQVLGAYYGIPMTNQLKKSIRAWARGGDSWEIILGLYVEEKRKGRKGPAGPPGMGR